MLAAFGFPEAATSQIPWSPTAAAASPSPRRPRLARTSSPKDTDSLLPPSLDADFEAGWDMLRREAFGPALYHDCSAQDIALASALLTPEPLAPSLAPIHTSERFASLPRAYIELTEDRAVTPAFQRHMHSRTPCDPVLQIEASHSAYFSAPDELADLLEGLGSD